MLERLQKIIAEAGVASRREAERLMTAGQVRVNGQLVRELGSKADPEVDHITVRGKLLSIEKKVYIKLYKPVGYLSSRSSAQGPSVLQLVKKVPERVYPVGRLDKDSEGLMILTNDGDYALQMMHPRYEHDKEYVVELNKALPDEAYTPIKSGMRLEGERLAPMKIKVMDEEGKQLRMILKEGKKRQIRRVMERFGCRVMKLTRVRIGEEQLGDLKPGAWEYFTPKV